MGGVFQTLHGILFRSREITVKWGMAALIFLSRPVDFEQVGHHDHGRSGWAVGDV